LLLRGVNRIKAPSAVPIMSRKIPHPHCRAHRRANAVPKPKSEPRQSFERVAIIPDAQRQSLKLILVRPPPWPCSLAGARRGARAV